MHDSPWVKLWNYIFSIDSLATAVQTTVLVNTPVAKTLRGVQIDWTHKEIPDMLKWAQLHDSSQIAIMKGDLFDGFIIAQVEQSYKFTLLSWWQQRFVQNLIGTLLQSLGQIYEIWYWHVHCYHQLVFMEQSSAVSFSLFVILCFLHNLDHHRPIVESYIHVYLPDLYIT